MVMWRVSLATLGVLAIQVGECSILSVLVYVSPRDLLSTIWFGLAAF